MVFPATLAALYCMDSIFSVPYCVGDSDCPLLFSCSSLGFSFASSTVWRTSSFGSRAAGLRIFGFLSLTRSLISLIRSPSFRIFYLIGLCPGVSFFPAVSVTALLFGWLHLPVDAHCSMAQAPTVPCLSQIVATDIPDPSKRVWIMDGKFNCRTHIARCFTILPVLFICLFQ